MIMNKKKLLIISLVLVVLMSTVAQAGFLSWLSSIFKGPSVTGNAVAEPGGECGEGMTCPNGYLCADGKCKEPACPLDVGTKLDNILVKLNSLKSATPSEGDAGGSPTLKKPEEPCLVADECMSGMCFDGSCSFIPVGKSCEVTAECVLGLTCINGACTFVEPQ